MKGKSKVISSKMIPYFLILGIALLSMACNFPYAQMMAALKEKSGQDSGTLSSDMLTAHACPNYTEPVQVEYADPAVPTPLFQNRPAADGVVNWLVLGSDFRPDAGFRTDTIILVSIDTKNRSVSVVSFPRDLYLTIPGWTTQRINTAMAHGGFSMLQDTLAYNFGVCPSGFVMTNFDGFKEIIDSLGGVDVNVQNGLSDNCDLPKDASLANGTSWCSVAPGVNHMDGASALWYVRSRYSTSDFDRLTRAQEVALAIFQKIASDPSSVNLPDLFAKYKDSIQTNLTTKDVLPMLSLMADMAADPSQIKRYAITPPLVHGFITAGGGDVQVPDFTAIGQVLDQAISTGK